MQTPRPTPRQATGPNASKWLTLASTSLGFSVVQLDVTIVNTALNSIAASLGGSIAALQWIVTAYTISFAAFILTAGALGDRVGARKVFIAGFVIFTIAALACAIAPTLSILIAARAIQGIGAAILIPNSLALLNHAYQHPTERAHAVGIWAAGASFSITAGPLVGGALIAAIGWRSIFIVNVPIGLVGIWITWRYVAETPATATREIDLLGQAAVVLALGCLAAAIIEGGAMGWSDVRVVAASAASVVSATLFAWSEGRARQPMLPLALFRRPQFTMASIVGLLVNIAFYGLIFVFSLYFQRENGYSALKTGLAFVPMMGAVLVTNLVAARVSALIGARATIGVGAAVAALACIGLLGIDRGSSYYTVAAQFIALGGGLGILVPPLTAMLLGSIEKERSGVASGVLNSARQVGSVLGVSLFGSLIGHAHGFIAGTRVSLTISAGLLVGGCVAMLLGTTAARRASR